MDRFADAFYNTKVPCTDATAGFATVGVALSKTEEGISTYLVVDIEIDQIIYEKSYTDRIEKGGTPTDFADAFGYFVGLVQEVNGWGGVADGESLKAAGYREIET